jgi:hypothetical protein
MTPEDITAGARTVAHMSDFFEELKASALELTVTVPAQERGHFTPEEDDRARALLVSYWQSRSALFELISSFRGDAQLDGPDRSAAFLVAFAAAVLLVDAARFLRENFDSHDVTRRKLNEAAPEFGIPAGTYDSVQQSLVSARHAWHLYHAVAFFEQNEEELRRLASGGQLAPVFAVIERLKHRLDMSVSQFARAKLRIRGGQVARRLVANVVGQAIYGLQKLVSSMMADVFVRPGHRPQLPDSVAAQFREILLPGDVLVVRKEYAITNYFLPGYWPHSALYLGNVDELERMGMGDHDDIQPQWAQLLDGRQERSPRVLESMKDGVRIRAIDSPFGADSLVVLRPQLDPKDIAAALAKVLVHEGKPYDFSFDFTRSDRLVCTEVVYRAYDGMGPINLSLTRRAGRLTLSGSDLITEGRQGKSFALAAVFAPTFSDEILSGPQADEIIALAQEGGSRSSAAE